MSTAAVARHMEHSSKNGKTPKWFHPHGFKMGLGCPPIIDYRFRDSLLIGTKIARVQAYTTNSGSTYMVTWNIVFSGGNPTEHVSGTIQMSECQFQDAFGISVCDSVSNFASSFNADAGAQGVYVREGNFLNIPGPGNGFDGDPNISIYLSDDIKVAATEFLRFQR